MRIVAGIYKGQVIKSPDASTTRPTTDRVREAVFSSLYSRLGEFDGVNVLDAFAGSGALGLEALSRGCAAAWFFEQDAKARRVLEDNIAALKVPRSAACVSSQDVFAAAARPFGVQFGLVLLDPPYAYEASRVLGLIRDLAASGSLAPHAVVAYEHALESTEAVTCAFDAFPALESTGSKRYGKIGVSYFEYHDAGNAPANL